MFRILLISLLRFLGLVSVSLPLVSSRALNQPRALPPSIDPFYKPPAGFESKAPGTILRQRLVISSFFGLIPDPVETWQLLYRTTAIDGSPIATVTTIFKPLFPKKDRFVSFHTAYDSSASICNPSYNYQLGALQVDLISSAEFLLLQTYLLSGYIVASPDYEGPDAAFSPGRLEGMGVLDGMRAVVNFKNTLRFSTSTPMIVGVGYSGGAIATGWAASLQPTYAPELAMKGWVQGGTPANLTGILTFIDNTLFSGFLPAAIDGLTKPSAYGAQLGPLVESIVTPRGRDILNFANANCAVANLIAFPEQSVLSTSIQSLGPGLLYHPDVVAVLQQNTMGVYKNETPTAPVFVYHASNDEVVPYANASTLVDAWCGYGASVKFTTFANGGHVTTEVVAILDALQFVKDAFAGTVPGGCSRNTELSSTLNPIALGVALEPLLIGLIEVLAIAGKNDANILKDIKTLGKH
ncbi:fungal-bacterial lipase domain protein [Metarhizium robertsii]|uniref:Lipase, secreted n=2 Tax=Metarhizium robertsii TaxID=568076 RepID=E9F7Y7_METRA|nr:Lipase, secreted [Metarhizium robertsii ARSEF 23]EFY96079.1 Lipase, secreted [Metarhizium robertsii ARSEF 23]EXU98402.1 fungal-bacterial lipase domain protein [Metarhizium robertsii]